MLFRSENRGFTFEDQVAAYRPESVETAQEGELLAGLVKKLQERTCTVPLRSGSGPSSAPTACAGQDGAGGVPKPKRVQFLEIPITRNGLKFLPT